MEPSSLHRAFCNASANRSGSMIPTELLMMCCPISTRLGHSVESVLFWLWRNKRLSSSVQEFVRDNTDKSTLHQGTALAHTDDLFPRDGVHKFQKIPVIDRDNVPREATLEWRSQYATNLRLASNLSMWS